MALVAVCNGDGITISQPLKFQLSASCFEGWDGFDSGLSAYPFDALLAICDLPSKGL